MKDAILRAAVIGAAVGLCLGFIWAMIRFTAWYLS